MYTCHCPFFQLDYLATINASHYPLHCAITSFSTPLLYTEKRDKSKQKHEQITHTCLQCVFCSSWWINQQTIYIHEYSVNYFGKFFLPNWRKNSSVVQNRSCNKIDFFCFSLKNIFLYRPFSSYKSSDQMNTNQI